MSGIDAGEHDRLRALVDAAGLPVEAPAIGAAKLRTAMQLDKKAKGKRVRFVLLHSLGNAFVTADYDEAALTYALEGAGALCGARKPVSRPAYPGGTAEFSRRVPARPRSHHSFDGVSPPDVQDPGLRQP